MRMHGFAISSLMTLMLLPAAAAAQNGYSDRTLDRAVGAAILSDISRDRQAERDAKRQPYATPGYGPIDSEAGARDACAADALHQVGRGAKLNGRPYASTMATGWEVEGDIDPGDGQGSVPFVCSVRNGSVTGVLLK